MTSPRPIALGLLLLGFVAKMATPAPAASMSTYLSLGDSNAFTSATSTPSNGDTGFVQQLADGLGLATGTRPNVVNVALPGETTGSFNSGNSSALSNANYTTAGETQNLAFLHAVGSGLSSGQSIDHVTISLGMADVTNLLNSPGFASLTLSQQATQLGQTLAGIQTQYSSLLGEVHALLPNAVVDLIGAYNPYHATPDAALAPIAEPAFLGLNKILQGEAATFGATYVDTYTSFLGREGSLTNILGGTGDTTLNAAGQAALASALIAANTPEPASIALGFVGLALLAMRSRRRLAGQLD